MGRSEMSLPRSRGHQGRDSADGLSGRVTQADNVDADVAGEYWRDCRVVESERRVI